ncbi:hypothetical protein ABZX85_35445 [Streptomyces sp. NPDC004539]|uniref:DUF7927 domain-containing protein n=1 Tax=Streptomyces sp. NPDC004539 TaxID=3154280 RepID=UPI0033AD576D
MDSTLTRWPGRLFVVLLVLFLGFAPAPASGEGRRGGVELRDRLGVGEAEVLADWPMGVSGSLAGVLRAGSSGYTVGFGGATAYGSWRTVAVPERVAGAEGVAGVRLPGASHGPYDVTLTLPEAAPVWFSLGGLGGGTVSAEGVTEGGEAVAAEGFGAGVSPRIGRVGEGVALSAAGGGGGGRVWEAGRSADVVFSRAVKRVTFRVGEGVRDGVTLVGPFGDADRGEGGGVSASGSASASGSTSTSRSTSTSGSASVSASTSTSGSRSGSSAGEASAAPSVGPAPSASPSPSVSPSPSAGASPPAKAAAPVSASASPPSPPSASPSPSPPPPPSPAPRRRDTTQNVGDCSGSPQNLQFPVTETFTVSQTSRLSHCWVAINAVQGSQAYLHGSVGNPYLQLTTNRGNLKGAYVLNDYFTAGAGVVTDFDYNINSGDGDGLSMFFMDAAATPNQMGGSGAGLGYACIAQGSNGPCTVPGMNGGWLGIGIDNYGNYSTGLAGNNTGPGGRPQNIVLRGSGQGTSGYRYLTGVGVNNGFNQSGDTTFAHLRVIIKGSVVTIQQGPSAAQLTTIVSNYDVGSSAGQAALPAQMKIGFAASTGGAYEANNIRNVQVTLPTNAATTKTGTSSVWVGQPVRYQIQATAKPDSVNGTSGTLVDTVPSNINGVTWSCSAGSGGYCGQSGQSASSGSGNAVSVPIGTPIGVTDTITVNGTAVGPGTITNTARYQLLGAYSNVDADFADTTANLTASARTTILADDFDVTPSGGSATTVPGGVTTVAVVVRNNGPNNAPQNATVTVKVPPYTFANTSGQPAGCTVDADQSAVTCTVQASALASGASVSLPISVTVYGNAPTNTQLTSPNGIQVSGFGDYVAGDDRATTLVNVGSAVSNLVVTKAANATQVGYGQRFQYTVTVQNQGPSQSATTVLTDRLPSGVTYVGDSSGGAYTPGTGQWNIGTMAAGTTATLTVTATMNSTTAQTNQVQSLASSSTDPSPCTGSNANCGQAVTVSPIAADISTTKSVTSPSGPIAPGQQFTYTVTASNAGPSPAAGVSATDTLPDRLTFVSSPDGCTAAGQNVTCGPNASIAAGSSASWRIVVTTSPSYTGNGSDIRNTATATSSGTPDPNTGDNTSTPSTPNIGGPVTDIHVSKVLNTTTAVPPGSTVQYTVWINNAGPSVATGATLTDTLPTGMTYVSGPSNCANSGQNITCSGIDIPVGTGVAYPFTVRISAAYQGDGSTIPNQASGRPGAGNTDPDPDNNTSARVPPNVSTPQADLTTAKSVTSPGGSGTVAPGQQFTYTVTTTNNGPSDARQATVKDTLPTQLAFVSSPDGCTASGQTVSCGPTATIAAGASKAYRIVVRLASSYTGTGADIRNVASSASGTQDPVPGNNTSTPSSPNVGPPQTDLQGTKVLGTTGQVVPGQQVVYTIGATNNGPSDAVGTVTLTDTLAAGTSFVSSSDSVCTASGRTVTCTGLSAASGRSVTARLTVLIAASYTGNGSDLGNAVTVSGGANDPNTANDTSPTVNPNVGAASADVATAKRAATQARIVPGQTFAYTVTTTNNGPSDARQVAVTDALPAQLAFVSSSTGCTATGQNVTCPTIATLGNGASQVDTVTVRLSPAYTGNGSDIGNVAVSKAATNDPTPGDNSSDPAPPPPVGAPRTALTLTKAGSATSYQPGQAFSYTVTLTNAGPSVAAGVSVADTLPLQNRNFRWTCAASSGSACGAAGGSGDLADRPTVAVGGTLTYVLSGNVTAGAHGQVTNTATVTVPSGTEDVNCRSTCTASVTVDGPDVTLVKTSSPQGAKPGATVTYTVTATNNGKGDASAFTFTDDLSDVVDDATFVNGSIDSGAGRGTYDSGAKKLTWTGPVAAGRTATVTYRVTVNVPPAGNGVLNNALTAPGTNCETGTTDDSCTDSNGGGTARITMRKTASPSGPVIPGTKVTYTVAVTNGTDFAYPGATFTDDLTDVVDDATYGGDATASAGTVSYTAPKLSWTGDVPANSTVTVTYSATVNSPDTGNASLANAVESTGDTNCAAGSADQKCSETVAVGILRIAKTASTSAPRPGQQVTYTVTVRNVGTGTYTGASFSDDLTDVVDDATFDNDQNASGGKVSYSAPTLSWSGDIAAGGSRTVTYSVTVDNPPGGDKRLNNAVTGPAGSNCATAGACSVDLGFPSLRLTKTSRPAHPVAGQTVTYTVTATNDGSVTYSGASWSDSLADLIDDGTYNGDADSSSGTPAYSSPTLSWTGDLPPGGSSTTTYSVTLANPMPGNKQLTNTVTSTPDTNCPPGTTNPACGNPTPEGVGQLQLTKTTSNSAPKPGDKVTYTVTVQNTGTGVYNGATFTDDLTDVLDDAAYGADATASVGTVAYASPKVTWSADLAAGATATVTYSATVDTPDTGNGTLSNAVTSTSGSNCARPSGTGCSTSNGVPQLRLTKTFSPANPVAGGTVTYTITARNTGTATYTGAAWSDDLTDLIDDGSYNGDANSSVGSVSYTAPTLSWTGTLTAGQTSTTTFSVTLGEPMPGNKRLTNVVASTSDTNCPKGTTSSACGNATPQGVGQLRIGKTVSNSAPKPGDKVTYTVTVQNTGTGVYNGATFTDDLTDVLDDAAYGGDATASVGTVAYASPKVTWSADLAAGATATVTYSATVNSPDSGDQVLGNAVTSTGGSNCAAGSRDPGCSTSNAVPQLRISKSVSEAAPQPGEKVTYTVTVANPSNSPYNGAMFTDDLTGVVDDAVYGADARASAGTVSYRAPELTWRGDVPAQGTVTVTYSATVQSDPARMGDKVLKNAVTSESPGANCASASGSGCSTASSTVPTLRISKVRTSTGQATPGSQVSYKVTVTNPSGTAYTNASYDDDLSGVLDDAAYKGDASASSGTVSYAAPKLSWSGGVPGNSSVTLTYSVTVNDPDTGDKQLTNTVVATSPGTNCPRGSTDPSCASTPAGVPALAVRKAVSDTNPVPGETLTYTVTLRNTGTADYAGASFSDDLTRVLDDATWLGRTSATAGTVAYSAPKVSWSGTVPRGGTVTVTYQVRVDAPDTGDGRIANSVTGPPGSNCRAGSADADCAADIDGVPALDISKSMSPSAPLQGQKATYTVTVRNTGGAGYPGASFTDDLTGVLDDAVYGGDASASAGTVSYSAPKLTWTGNVAAGASVTVTYSVTVNNPDTGDQRLTNAVTGPAGSNCARPSGTGCTTSNGVPQLRLTKTRSPANPVAGQKVTYTVTARNTGTAAYAGAVWSDDLSDLVDDGTYNADADASSGDIAYSAPKLSWNGTLAAGAVSTTTYSVLLGNPMPGNKRLTNMVTSTPDTNCGQGTASSECGNSTTPLGVPQLTYRKTASTAVALPGAKVTYTVTVRNSGTAAYRGAAWHDDLTDVLDDAAYDNDASASSGSVSYASPEVSWTGDLAAGATATVTYSVTVADPDTGNQRLANAVVSDSPGSNCGAGSTDSDCAPAATGVPALAVTKTVSPSVPLPGETLTYTVTLKNTGTADYTGAVVSDDLTDVLDDAAWAGGTTASTGAVNYTAPVVGWRGDVAQGATETFTYAVRVNDPDTGDRLIDNKVVGPVGSNCAKGSADPRCSADIPGVPELHITKTQSPATPTAGQVVRYSVVIENTGTADYAGAVVSDDLTGVLDDAVYRGDATATAGSVTYTAPTLKWSGDVAAGASATVTYSVTVHNPDTGDQRLVNAVGGPQGSNCRAGRADADCSSVSGVGQLRIRKTFSPAAPVPGDTVTYTVTVENTGTATYAGAAWSDDLSGVLDDASYGNDAAASGGSVSYADPKLSWRGNVGVGDTVTVTYSVTLDDPGIGDGRLTNTVTSPGGGTNCPSGASQTDCSPVPPGIPRLSIAKSASSATPLPGQKVTYTVTLRNTGQADYAGAAWSDDLTEVLDDAVYGGDATASAGTVSYAAPKLSWTGTVPRGGTVTVRYSVTVGNPDTGDHRLVNSVTGPAGSNCAAGKQSAACTTGGEPGSGVPDLRLTKTSSEPNPLPGRTVTYTITARNTGTAAYVGAVWSDDLTGVLDDATYGGDATASIGTVRYGAPTLSWSGDVPAGATATVTYSVTVDSPDTGDKRLANAVVSTPDTNCGPGSADPLCGSGATGGVPSIRFTKSASTSAPLPGQTVTYTVTALNEGTATFNGAVWADDLSDVLDDAAYNGDASASIGGVSYASPTLSWSGNVPAGATATVTYSVTVKANPARMGDGVLANAVTSTSPGSNCGTSPACSVTSNAVPSLRISKVASTTRVVPGDAVSYTVTVTNPSGSDYPGATYTDQVTEGAGLLNRRPVSGPSATSGTVTPGDGFDFTWTGDLAAGASSTVTYTYLANAVPGGGEIVNQITGAGANSTCFGNRSDAGYPVGCGATVAGPEYEFAEAPDSYRTSLSVGGPYHVIVPGLFLGKGSFADVDGHPGGARLDESGRGPTAVPVAYSGQRGYSVPVRLTNSTGSKAMLAAWLDHDFDGTFDQGERITRPLADGATSVTLSWPDAEFAKAGTTYMRLRLYGAQPADGVSPELPAGETRAVARVGGSPRSVPVRRALPADPRPVGYGGAGQVEDFRVPVREGRVDVHITTDKPRPRPGDRVTYTVSVCSPTGTAISGATAGVDLSEVLKYATYGRDARATAGRVEFGAGKVSWRGTAPGDCARPVRVTFTVVFGRTPPSTPVTVPVTGGPTVSNCPPGVVRPGCSVTVTPVPLVPSSTPAPRPLPDTGDSSGRWGWAAVGLLVAGCLLYGVPVWVRRRRRG